MRELARAGKKTPTGSKLMSGGRFSMAGRMCSRDVRAGSAELADGCEGSSPPRKGGHSVTSDEPRLELDTVERTNYWGLHYRCLSGGPMSMTPCESTMKSDASFAVLFTPRCTTQRC